MPFPVVSSIQDTGNFKNVFRMSWSAFEKLLCLIAPDISRNEDMGLRAGRPVIIPDTRLATTLRMLAGGRVGDMHLSFGVPKSSTYSVFRDTVNALMKCLNFPGLPTTTAGLEASSIAFKTSRTPTNPPQRLRGGFRRYHD